MSDLERRVVDPELLEIRVEPGEDGKPSKIVGKIPYNSWSKDLGGFREVIRPGAFSRSLEEGADVKARIEHKGGLLLIGRTKNGTLTLRDTPEALLWEAEPPDTSAGRDILTLAERKDIDKASFAFRVRTNGQRIAETEEGRIERELLDVELVDVAPVSDPAYEDATVATRAIQAHRKHSSKTLALKAKLEGALIAS